jgi:hypothetical protein
MACTPVSQINEVVSGLDFSEEKISDFSAVGTYYYPRKISSTVTTTPNPLCLIQKTG